MHIIITAITAINYGYFLYAVHFDGIFCNQLLEQDHLCLLLCVADLHCWHCGPEENQQEDLNAN